MPSCLVLGISRNAHPPMPWDVRPEWERCCTKKNAATRHKSVLQRSSLDVREKFPPAL